MFLDATFFFFSLLRSKKMWTFLGLASFTYLYKKSHTVLSVAYKELVMAAVLFLTVGLLLSYFRYFHGQKLRVPQVLKLPLSFLSFLPVINHLVPQTASQRSGKAENTSKKVSQLQMDSCKPNYVTQEADKIRYHMTCFLSS